MATISAMVISKEATCEDVTECDSVDNIVRVLIDYDRWNKEQLKKNPWHSSTDYSALETTKQKKEYQPIHSPFIAESPKHGSIISSFMDDAQYTEISLLDDFNHVLSAHCCFDRAFEWIYSELTNEIASSICKSNNIVHRNNYSRDILYDDIELIKQLYYGYYESKEIHEFEILDKIYIYFLHCFDFGFRFSKNYKLSLQIEERERIETESKSQNDSYYDVTNLDNIEINIDETLNTIKNKLKGVKTELIKYNTFKSRFNESNRFRTNYNDAMLLNIFNESRDRGFGTHLVVNNDEDDDKAIDCEDPLPSYHKQVSSNQIMFNTASLRQLAAIQGRSNEVLEASAHLMGRRWHYSNNLANCNDVDTINGGVSGDWFIESKYSNIKDEILNNSIYRLSMNGWIFNYDLALIHIDTARAKNTHRVMGDRWKTFYDDNQKFNDLSNPQNKETRSDTSNIFLPPSVLHKNESVTISINHILVILFYCNSALLSRYFRATYIESSRWKLQHSEFANLGRLLRESIEDYGTSIYDESMKKENDVLRFYHGLAGSSIVFGTTMIRFCCPISCSVNCSVIQMYISDSNGMVLECKEYTKYLRFFNSNWLSQHCAENERIFCGGDWPLRINSILDIAINYNYKYYLRTINILTDLIRGEYNTECEFICEKIKYTFNRLFSSRLWMKNAVPAYIDALFAKYCNNLGVSIEIDMEYMNVKSNGYLEIKSLIFDIDRIKFDVLCCVFSNVQIFKFIHYKLCHETFIKLFQFLSQNKYRKEFESKLKYIIFAEPNQNTLNCKDIIKNYQKQFKQIKWFIEYKKKNQFDMPMLLFSSHKIKINDDCLIM